MTRKAQRTWSTANPWANHELTMPEVEALIGPLQRVRWWWERAEQTGTPVSQPVQWEWVERDVVLRELRNRGAFTVGPLSFARAQGVICVTPRGPDGECVWVSLPEPFSPRTDTGPRSGST